MKIEIMGFKTKISDKQRKYIEEKIGGLEKYIPKRERESARTEVRIKPYKVKEQKQLACEATIRLPQNTLVINESSSNIFAAIDGAENRLKLALKKHKEKRFTPKLHQRMVQRLEWR